MFWFGGKEIAERIERLEIPFNQQGIDPFGISKQELRRWLGLYAWFYRNYFKVSVSGLGNVPARGRVMLVGNHSGGVALDGSIVMTSLFLELEPPRLTQGMVDKFLGRVPFVGNWLARTGQFIGIPEHAEQLLRAERMLLVFPEGSRGTAKLYGDRNTLVDFGTGFMRLALSTRTPILPFAFLGGGEAIPTMVNLYRLGKLFGMPYVPVTPYLLPVPRPVPLEIYYSEPMMFEGAGDEDDLVISRYVTDVRARIAQLIDQGEHIRRGRDTQVSG
jgi:1-acyl-sn-glycerol-3-phosphate acyltransferase